MTMNVNGYEIKSGANLYGANLRGANLCDADLSSANLSGADLYDADLYDADLRGANLYDADLRGANLCDANLCDADLSSANLSGADLRGAKGIVRAGPTIDGYEMFAVKREGKVWIKAGCRWFTSEEARKHWIANRADTEIGKERLLFVDFLEKMIDRL